MTTWFIFVLISVFAVSIAEISQKLSLTQKVNISAVTNNFYVWGLMGTAGVLLSILTGKVTPLTTYSDFIKLFVLGIVYFLGGTLFYSSYKGNSPSISQILSSVSVLVSTFLGIIFFREGLELYKVIGTFLIVTAIVLLNFNKQEKFNRFNLLALLGGICYGIAYSIDKSFSLNLNPFNYLIYMSFSVALISFLIKPKLIISDTRKMAFKEYRHILVSSIFFTIFDVSMFFAYKKGASVGVADAMNSISIFLVILAEIFILKDRTNIKRKLACAGLALAGVLFFSLLK